MVMKATQYKDKIIKVGIQNCTLTSIAAIKIERKKTLKWNYVLARLSTNITGTISFLFSSSQISTMWEYFDNFKYFNRSLGKKQQCNSATTGQVPLVEIVTRMNAHEYFKTTCNLQKMFKFCKGQ